MKKLSLVFGLVLVVSCLLLVNSAFAVPMAINMQGKVTPTIEAGSFLAVSINRNGTPIWARAYFVVTSRALPVGINQVFVNPDNGVFNLVLEKDPAAAIEFPKFIDDASYALGVGIIRSGRLTPLNPPQSLVSVPFAITAKNVSGGVVGALVPTSETDSNIPAVAGVNMRNAGGGNPLAFNPGVAGTSAQGYGVVGIKLDDADNDAKAGVLGTNLETAGSASSLNVNPGVLGLSVSGHGVMGWVSNANKAGVFGYNADLTSLARTGPGVYGWGTVGVMGNGSVAGGSFESASGIGVIGRRGTNQYGMLGANVYTEIVSGVVEVATGGAYAQNDNQTYGMLGYSGNIRSAFGAYTPVRTAGAYGFSYSGYGVYGKSSTSVGVFGSGDTAGGSFESTSGIGMYASSIASGNFDSPFKVKTFHAEDIARDVTYDFFNAHPTEKTIYSISVFCKFNSGLATYESWVRNSASCIVSYNNSTGNWIGRVRNDSAFPMDVNGIVFYND